MEFAFVIALCFMIVILLIRLISIKKELKSINNQFDNILNSDTNANITVSTNDKNIREMVVALNSNIMNLRKKELRLNSKNNEISTAITNISHDLRTPLTSISGYAQMIEDADNMDSIKRYSQIIAERSRTMQNLTEELFRYSVILSQDRLKPEAVNLKTELENALAENYSLLVENSITPVISLADTDEKILDRMALSRVLNNIISNSAKYSDGDLYVTLTEDATIVFKNTASNLDEVQVSKLFDRFYTVSNERKSTGIGLSIAKHLTEQMGGTIDAKLDGNMLVITLQYY